MKPAAKKEHLKLVRKPRRGNFVWCPHCGGSHPMIGVENTGSSDWLLFFRCGDDLFPAWAEGPGFADGVKPLEKLEDNSGAPKTESS